jgi:hypothetical protein
MTEILEVPEVAELLPVAGYLRCLAATTGRPVHPGPVVADARAHLEEDTP